jgi:hypothetical protein
MATSSSVVKEIKIIVNGGQATASIDGVTVSTKKLNSELAKLSQNAGKGKGASGATGGATATVLELGRTISDSNYGIRGMANNLSQLASNLVFTTRAAGGLGAGLKSILSAMMGPLGLVLAFQGFIALLEKSSIESQKAGGAAKDLSDELISVGESVAKSASFLKIFLREFETMEKEELAENVKRINNNFTDLNITLDENNKITKESVIALKEKVVQLQNVAKAQAIQGIIEEKYAQIEKQRLKVQEELKKEGVKSIEEFERTSDDFARVTEGRYKGLQDANKVRTKATLQGLITDFRETETLINTEIDALIGRIPSISDLIADKEPKGKRKTTRTKDEEEFEFPTGEGVFWTTEDYDTAMQLDFDMTQRYLDSRRVFSDEQRVLNQEENLKLLNDQILHQENITVLEAEGSIERLEAESILSMMRMDLQDAELQHELDTIEAKKNAQMQYVNFAGQLGGVLGNIAGKNKELATAALVIEKGAAIAGVVVQASASIAQRTAANAAIPAFLPPGIPNPAKVIDTALMPKDIAMTKVSAGLSIAAILASAVSGGKKNVPSARGGATSVGAVGGGDRTFDFNLVGSTGTNQLAEAVGSQFQEPVQAYVVSSQMTSQQELDLQISTGASLGGD